MLAVPAYEVRPQSPGKKLNVVPSAGEDVQKKHGGLLVSRSRQSSKPYLKH